MGSILTSIWGKLFKSDRSFSILIVGLANAGKTTLLYRMYFIVHEGYSARSFKPLQQSAATSNK